MKRLRIPGGWHWAGFLSPHPHWGNFVLLFSSTREGSSSLISFNRGFIQIRVTFCVWSLLKTHSLSLHLTFHLSATGQTNL
jgi:hypothetical protein